MLRRFLIALQFLTIIPVRVRGEVTGGDMARSAALFPLVGLLQGLLLVALGLLLGMVFPPELAAALVLVALALSNGGLHLDGLADTFDAIAAPGTKERKLAVMKDSSIGPLGVAAVVFALGIKYLSLMGVVSVAGYAYYTSLLLMPVASKFGLCAMMLHGRPAREDGLGRAFIGGVRPVDIAMAAALTAALMAMPALVAPRWAGHMQFAFAAGAILSVYVLALLFTAGFRRAFGGLTGDTLGASSEVIEITFLWIVLIWSRFYTS